MRWILLFLSGCVAQAEVDDLVVAEETDSGDPVDTAVDTAGEVELAEIVGARATRDPAGRLDVLLVLEGTYDRIVVSADGLVVGELLDLDGCARWVGETEAASWTFSAQLAGEEVASIECVELPSSCGVELAECAS